MTKAYMVSSIPLKSLVASFLFVTLFIRYIASIIADIRHLTSAFSVACNARSFSVHAITNKKDKEISLGNASHVFRL